MSFGSLSSITPKSFPTNKAQQRFGKGRERCTEEAQLCMREAPSMFPSTEMGVRMTGNVGGLGLRKKRVGCGPSFRRALSDLFVCKGHTGRA